MQAYIFIAIAVIAILWLAIYLSGKRPAPPTKYISPQTHKIYMTPHGWKGTPIDQKGRYVNEEYPFYQNYIDIIKWFPGNAFNLIRNYKKNLMLLSILIIVF